eukprot:scaffold201_cov405-Prasinococcus_capsulatus_cf.AAC.48
MIIAYANWLLGSVRSLRESAMELRLLIFWMSWCEALRSTDTFWYRPSESHKYLPGATKSICGW